MSSSLPAKGSGPSGRYKMTTFLEDIRELFGAAAASQAAVLLAAMDLPDAASYEYLDGVNNATLFINRYGLTIRAGEAMSCPEHDLILRPFRSMTSIHRNKKISVELLPGIEGVLKNQQDLKHLINALAKDKIHFHDSQLANGGYLPCKTAEMPDGVPVVLDRGAVESIHHEIKFSALKKLFRRYANNMPPAAQGLQAELYKPLTRALRTCWPRGTSHPIAPLQPFLERCAAEIAKSPQDPSRLLSSAWSKNWNERYQGKPCYVSDYARAYEKRLSQTRAHSAKPE